MILGIETSTTRASLALYDPGAGEVVWRRDFTTDRAHNAVIFEPISEMMETYRDQLTGIAVGVGPGSYSGVRVGVAVANGLGLSLGIPTMGCSSLEAWEVEEDSYVVVSDARRKTIAVAEVVDRQLRSEPELIECGDSFETEFEKIFEPFLNRNLPIYSSDQKLTDLIAIFAPAFSDAAQIARRAGEVVPANWPEAPLEPHYLRAPYITTPKKKAL